MASIKDILNRAGMEGRSSSTDPIATPVAPNSGAGYAAQAIREVIRDTRAYNVQQQIKQADHNNPLLTTANLENSNPLISIPANTLNLGGRILSNMGQGVGNAEALYHEVRANSIEGTLPQEVFDMQSKVDYAEAELAALNAKLMSGNTGSLQEHMKLIGEISSKSAELTKQKLAIEKTGYGDSIRELKEQRKTAQFKADRSVNGMDTIFNTKQRDEVQRKIQTEVDSWKLANPDASALEQITASSKIAAKHYTDNPLEIGNMAVESAAALINPYTLAASAASQGANFYVNQTKKYNEAEGRTATGLVSGKEHAALAAGTAAYTALNFYADKVMQKAIFPSANSAFQRAEAAALEAAAKGATDAAALRTAANALRPTVKGTVGRGLLAAGQEYPVEGLSSMMEEQWGHGRHTGDWTPFGVGGTAGLLAGGAMTAPSTLAGVGGAVVGNVAAAQADAATDLENKKYNPTTDMAQAYGDILNSPNAAPEQITAARTKAKDILGSTQSRLSEMTQIQEAVASGDVDAYFASVLEKDIETINSQIASGELTDAEAIAKVDELEAAYELLAEKASEYVGKAKKLDSEVNKLRKDLVASTQYHAKMSENINLAPDTIQSIKERQAIIEDDTASLEDLERAIQDIIAYPMVATVSQLQKAMSLPNLTPEAYETLRILTDFQMKYKGESLSKVRRHITEGSTGYRGLPEYIQGLTQALIDGDTNNINGLMYDIGAFAQSHEKKAEAMADAIKNVPAGSEWQIARDKQNQWYVIKDEAKFLTGEKARGAYTVSKGSVGLLNAILEEVQMIKDTQAAMQATMDLREQMQIEPTDMSTYNRIKYAGQLPLTHATTMEEVAKFEAMLDEANQVVAFDAEGNPHNVTVTGLHPHDASKVMVTIEGESKKFATTRDRLAVFDGTGNLLYDVRNQEDNPTTSTTGSETETDTEVNEQANGSSQTESNETAQLGEVTVEGVEALLEDGVARIRVFNDGVEVPFKSFAVTLTDDDTAEVGMVERDQSSAPRGIGTAAYIALGNALAERGVTLTASSTLQADGRKLWNRLVDQGYAEYVNKRFVFTAKGSTSNEDPVETETTSEDPIEPTSEDPIEDEASSESETSEDTAADIGKKTMQALAEAQLEVNPNHHSADGIVDGQFAGMQGLNINDQGNVVLTRLANNESHLTKDWVAVDAVEMESTSITNGGGRGLPTSGFSDWQDQYGTSRTAFTATFEIAPDELIQAIRDGNAYIGNMGEGEIVLNPAYARNYLKQVNGKDVRVLDNGYLQYTDGTMVETFDDGDVDENGLPMSISFGTEVEVEAQSNEESDSDPRADVAGTETTLQRKTNDKGDIQFTGVANAGVRELVPTKITFRKQEDGTYISKSREVEFDYVEVTDPDAQMQAWLDEGKLIQLDSEGKPLPNAYFNRDPKTSLLTVNSSNVEASFTKGDTTTYLMKDGLVFFQSPNSPNAFIMKDQVFTGIPFNGEVEARLTAKGIANKETKSEPFARLTVKQFKQLEKLDKASAREVTAILHPDTPFAELLAERTKALIKEYNISVVDKPKSEKTLIVDFNGEGGFKKVDGNIEINPHKSWVEHKKADPSVMLSSIQDSILSPMMYDPRVKYLYVPATFERSTPEVDALLAAIRGEDSTEAPETEPTTLNIWAGTGENASLSNLAERPFTVKGRAYRSVEHAYQSLKSGKFDQATYDKYQNRASVEGVKIVGTLGTNQEISEPLMKALITASFRQNPEALAQLLDTGEAILTHTQDRGHWKEAFPRILMKVREELREAPKSTKGNTPPKSGNKSTGIGQASISNVSIVGQRLEDMQEEARNEAIAEVILQKVDIQELVENISSEWQMAVSTRVTNAVLMAYNNLRYKQESAKLKEKLKSGSYTKEQINELENELDDRNFGEELYNEVNGSQDDSTGTGDTNVPTKHEDRVMYSGGAYGADALFHHVAAENGMTNITHFTGDSDKVASKYLRDQGVEAKQVPKDYLAQARQKIKELLGRTLKDDYAGNLHARNYYQVVNADAVYAVAPLKDAKSVTGGTNTAVQLGIALGKQVHVWDTTSQQWHTWDGSKFTPQGTPELAEKFAGVGTRDIESYTTKDKATGKWVSNPKYLGDDVRRAAFKAVRELFNQTQANVPPQAETPVEEQTEASETTPQYPRTVTAEFEVEGLDEAVKGEITFNGDGTATVTVGKKILSIEVTPENEKSFKQLGNAINLADPSIELSNAQLLTAEEQAKIRAEIYGEDADKATVEDDPTEEINSRTDGGLDEVNVEDAEGLLDALKDPSSELGKRFKQVGSQVFPKPFIAVKDFFSSFDFNATRIFEYLKQFLAKATNSITEDDVNTMHALRNFHQGMQGNNFSKLIKAQVDTMLKVTDPRLLTAEHNLFSQMITFGSDGYPVIEENVLGAMSVAAYDYIIKNADFHVNSDKGINFMLGVTSDQFIRGEDSKKYRRLTTRREKLIQELGDSAVRALGIKTKKEFTEDEALKLGASMGAVIYHAMKQRYLNEKFYYRHSILADVQKHMGYTTAKRMYEDWMEQKYAKGEYLPYPKYLKALRQFNRIITNPNSGLMYKSRDGIKPLHEFIQGLQGGTNDKMIPFIGEADLIANPKYRNASDVRTELLGLVKELWNARTEMNTPTYFAGIVQDERAIKENEDPRNQARIREQGKRDEQSPVVKAAIRGVPKRSDTLHKVFGLDRGKVDPLTSPVPFTQQDIKKSKGRVSTEQARILNKIQQEPLIVKSFTRSVSWLNKNYTDMLHDLIGAKPALDTLYVDKRVNADAAARNLIKELDQAIEYVDTITNDDGTWNKFYHELVVWSNNRFGYASNVFNLQTSKIARAMSTYEANVAVVKKTVTGTSTRSIFRKNKQLTEYGKLLHGVAIYAEKSTSKKNVIYDEDYMGDTTVDKAPNEVLLPKLHKRLYENFQPHFDAIRKMIAQKELTDEDQALIKELVGEMGSGIQSLEAAVELANFWDTKKGGTFQSHLTVESDGITNGMIINQIQNGTASIDMLVEGGLLTTNEMRDNLNASFFTLKRDGRNGEALKDYYTRAGERQKEAWEFIESKLNLGAFDTTMPDEQNLVQAIAFIDKTFGERKGAKAFATPDNYAAGLDRIKEIVADHFVDNLFGAVEDFGKAGDNEGLSKLLEATNTIIRFHNKYLAEIDGLESKWNAQKKRFEVQYSGTVNKTLLKRAMLTATSQHAAQDKFVLDSEGKLRAEHVIFDDLAAVSDLASYGKTVMDLVNLYPATIVRQLGLKKDAKLPTFEGLLTTEDKTPEEIQADRALYRERMDTYLINVLHAQSSQFRSYPVPEVNTDVASAQIAVNYRLWDDNQLNALRAVSNVTQGTATVHTLKRMNGQFYMVRDANIAMMRVAYNVYQTIWDTVARQILDRRIRKTGLPTDELNNETPLTSLLTIEDVKELERTMQKFLPTGTTAFSRKSKNRSTSGAVFLDKVAKLFTEAIHTQNIRFDKENKTVDNYLTGVYKEVEQSIGLKGNSTMTQSVDAYVSTNALDKVLGGNFHDSNGFNIANYQEGAQAQNTAFFDAMVEHSAQEGFADAVLIPLKAFLADRTVIKSEAVIDSVLGAARTLGQESVPALLTIMLQAEIRKVGLLSHVARVQQYGTEDGHVDVTPEQKAKIAESVKRIAEGKTSIQELADLISTPNDEVKVITPTNPLPSYATTLHSNTVGQAAYDADAAEEANVGNTFVQTLLAQGTENLDVADVVKTVEDYLDANPSELSKYYKLVLGMLPDAVKAGTKVNIFNPHAIPAHVKGEKVLQMERHTQGWYTEKQINLVYSTYAALTPETFVHETIHAALANFIRTELRKVKKDSNGKLIWDDVHPAVRDLLNIRNQVKAAIEADPNLEDFAKEFEVALKDIQEFVTYGMTNKRFINVLKGIYIKQTAQHKDKSKFSLIGSLRSAFTAFIESATEMLLGKTAKYKGKGKDAKINALAALVTNVSANLQAASEATTDMDFDEILQHVQTNAQNTQQKIREMKPKEIFEKLHQGNLSIEFQNHLRTDVLPLISEISESIGSTEVGRMFNEQVDPQTIWDDAVINGKVPYTSDLFSIGFPMSDQEAYAVESLEASLNAIIDYSYGSTVHREMDRMFNMARNKLKPRDFHDGDWMTATVNEKMVAREKWNKLFNLSENLDNEGRNRFLTRFMALTLGSEKFNKLLNKVDPVPEELEGADTVYEYILNRFHRFIDWIAERAARTGNEPKIQGRIRILAHQLAEIDAKRKNHLMNQSSKNPFMNVDSFGSDVMEKVRLAMRSLVEAEMFRKSPLTPVKAASEFGSLLLKQNLEELPDQIMQLRANLHPNTLPGAIAEIQQEMGRPVGIRKKIMAMISLNSNAQKERETMRQHIQREITQMFDERGEYLEAEDWKALTNVILRSGLSRLYFEEYEPNVIYDLIRDKEARQEEIASIEAELRQDIDGGVKIHRTKQLARYMATGKAHILQAQNTLQISAGVGLKDNVQVPSWFDPEVKLLNRLVSLYNLNYQDQTEIQRVSKVLDREASRLDNGVEHLLRFHQKLAADSAMQFADNPFSQSQSYTPEIHNTNRDIQFVANKAEEQLYERLGYKELAGSELSKAFYDVAKTKVKIMVNMHADNQRIVDGGLMLNTTDAKGTDIGIEDIKATTKQLARKLIRESRNPDYDPSKDTETHGVPKLNAEGMVTGMRYTMLNKTRDDLLERNNHPADLMAEYAASNLDLMNVEKVNTPVLEALHQDYLDNYETRPQDFVELSSKSDDPELVRMYRMIPYKSREYLKSLFGDDPIMINANVMTIAFGYRKYTPTDIFKKDADERNIAEAAYAGILNGIFGEERAATVSSHMIKGTMEIMRKVKDFYVIRNFFTLFNNILTNNAILLAYGVSPVAMARDTKVALQAGLKYKKDYSLYIQYKVKLQLGIGNMGENRQKMAYYEDSLKRNPLKEFIEAGMMSSIVEDIEQSKDDYSYQAALEKKVAGVVDTIPKLIRDGVNFVMVNQGSPLHKMLSDTTSMSDFVAKYVLYNYHTKKKGMSHAEALFESHEAFINYEVPSNKAMQFLNDIGLVMFTKYYLRIQRVIYILLRKHPASVLLQSYLLGSIAGMPTVLESFVPSTMNLPLSGSVFESFSAVGEPIPLQLIF